MMFLLVVWIIMGPLLGAAGMSWIERRQAQRDARAMDELHEAAKERAVAAVKREAIAAAAKAYDDGYLDGTTAVVQEVGELRVTTMPPVSPTVARSPSYQTMARRMFEEKVTETGFGIRSRPIINVDPAQGGIDLPEGFVQVSVMALTTELVETKVGPRTQGFLVHGPPLNRERRNDLANRTPEIRED